MSEAGPVPVSESPFAPIPAAPPDPILGLTEAFRRDPNPHKVNLGVGVYLDAQGVVPTLHAVRAAEARLLEAAPGKGYLPIDGDPEYNRRVQALLLGENAPVIREGRAVTVQAPGGTGALRVGADFLHRFLPDTTVFLSAPSWENHAALFGTHFRVQTYPYYDPRTHGLDFAGMMEAFVRMPRHSVVVLHACCHNPTGVDLSAAQWVEVLRVCRERALVPFLDFAYQGFAEGIEADAFAVRLFAESGLPCLIANSFSKSFSLYGERVGALTLVAATADEAQRALSQIKRVVRVNYSNPPAHGALVVSLILGDATLRQMWEAELTGMRERIQSLRRDFVQALGAQGVSQDFGFILQQRGMFSYSGLSRETVLQLRQEGLYIVESGRICIAAMNERNLPFIAEAIARHLRSVPC
ncbi:MAG: amino acid aminotransferase [Chloroherpetonaceae bacterium]|nr:aspartate/tyrosine/aromatic aminotransferase [Chthonomonadaceae bacterium]MDW8208077.1 amino acid aminotransferase [Chloroherpetonaceae bacterium]